MTAKLHRNALAHALCAALTAARSSADIGQQVALERICEHEGAYDWGCLLDIVRKDPVDFILVAAPGFTKWLKLATGKNRDEWANLIS